MTSLERCKAFGVANIRGMAYMPGPSNYTKGQKGTPYFDSDFYNNDFKDLWQAGDQNLGRHDLLRFKDQLGVNFIHCYDWTAPMPEYKLRIHTGFLADCAHFGMKATIPISNYTMELLSKGDVNDAANNVRRVFQEIYPSKTPVAGAGMWKIFNEYELWYDRNPAHVVTVVKWLVEFENNMGLPDATRMPIMVDASFGVKDGIPGAGYIRDVWNAVLAAGKIGSYAPDEFWKERFVFATNPQNDAGYIEDYLANLLPAYWQTNNIPIPPVMFTELGSNIQQTGSEEKQAEWMYAQIEASLPGTSNGMMLGACVFLNEERPWEAGGEQTFGIMRFGPDTDWGKPSKNYLAPTRFPWWDQLGNFHVGTGTFPVEQQRPKLNYASVAKAWHSQTYAELTPA
jgi:hypothetical protein